MKNLIYYYKKAIKNNFGLGAFNFQNLEELKAICGAAEEEKSPVIVAISEGALSFLGEKYLLEIVKIAKKEFKAPIFLHLDHGKSFAACKKAVDSGFDSVMIDASDKPLKENVALTKKVAEYAHKKGVFVEGELGKLSGIKDNKSDISPYTDPDEAKFFVDKTSVDSLAVAIGTSHGAYKFSGKAELKFDVLEKIEKTLPSFPIVLHGASSVDQQTIKSLNALGADIGCPVGVDEKLTKIAIKKHNIVKINMDTDLRLAYTLAIKKSLADNPKNFDPRKYIGAAQEMVKQVVKNKIKNLLFSNNQA